MGELYRQNNKTWGEYSLVEHLRTVCSKDEKYKNLYAVWTLDQETHSRALAGIYYNFPHYSMHDESHSLSIINKIEMLLGEDRIRSLSPTDTFLILESAYLHDIGMIIAQKELLEEWKKPTFKIFLKELKENSYDKDVIDAVTYLLKMQEDPKQVKEDGWPIKTRDAVTLINSEYYRSKHSIRSANFIDEGANIGLHSNYKKLIPNRLIVLLQKIAVSHGSNFEDTFNKLEHIDNGIGTDRIHPRFISCLLRLGDLLDLDDGRFNATFENLASFPNSSKAHKEKHRSITLFLVSPEKIQVSAVCKRPEVYRETRSWFDWLKEEIKNLSSRWSDIVPKDFKGGPPSLGNINLSTEGSENISDGLALQFNIDQKKAFELIEGQGIYSNRLVFIRELIQNAMDATKIQMWKDIKNGKYDAIKKQIFGKDSNRLEEIKEKKYFEFPSDLPTEISQYYPINITVTYDEEEKELEFSIEDRGHGISIKDLKRMENVGGSWTQDRELSLLIDKMPKFLRPTGNFGLGLHSVFLVTDELKIETKSEDDIAYDLTFESRRRNGYIAISKSNKRKIVGSKISLKIRGKSNIDKCIESNRSNRYRDRNEYYSNELDVFDSKYDEKTIYNEIMGYTKKFTNNIQMFDINVNNERVNEYKNIGDIKGEFIDIDEDSFFRRLSNDLMDIEIRDSKEGIVIHVKDVKHETKHKSRSSTLKFKDIILETSYISKFVGYDICVNIYKGKAKSILGVSREMLNGSKYKSIKNRIEGYLLPNIMSKLGKDIQKIKSTSQINDIGNESIVKFLLAYVIYVGEPLKIDNSIAKNIIIQNVKILENGEIQHNKNINYYEFINLENLIYYISENDLEVIDESVDVLESGIKAYIFETKPYNYDGLNNSVIIEDSIEFYIFEHFDTEKVVKQKSNIIFSMKKKKTNIQVEFVNEKDRNNYILDLINQRERVRISPIKSRENNIFNVLMVDKYISGLSTQYVEDRFILHHKKWIISPIYNMPKNIFLEKELREVVEFLKRERHFNELIKWVSNNSILKDSYKENNIERQVEIAYEEFIKECIDVSRKKAKIDILENKYINEGTNNYHPEAALTSE